MACNGERIVTFKKRRDSLWSMYSDSSTEEDSQKPCKTELLGALDEGKTSHAYQYGSPSALQSLRGLRKLGVVARGSQGAIYAAKDRTRVGEVPGEEEEEEEECWRMVVVKRLYSRQNGYGRVGIDPTVLREPTILRYVHQQQQRLMRSGPKEKLSDHNNAGDNDRDGVFLTDPTMPSSTLIDETARVVELYRVVEAPFQELCLVLEACMTDLQELCVVSN